MKYITKSIIDNSGLGTPVHHEFYDGHSDAVIWPNYSGTKATHNGFYNVKNLGNLNPKLYDKLPI